jgi:hypothetical protein
LEVNVETVNPAAQAWKCLRGKIAAEILIAPKTGGDPHNAGDWPAVPGKVVGYLERNIVGNSWADMLALLAALMAARRYEMNTVFSKLVVLHTRFKALFQTLILEDMVDWDATQYIPGYLKGEFLPSDSQNTRQRFWVDYQSASKLMSQWLASLPTEQQQVYQPFILPPLAHQYVAGLTRFAEITQQQQRARKAETDAVVPKFAAIRAEAHFRYNRITRLHRAYDEALQTLNRCGANFPLSFSYEEGGGPEHALPAQERLSFRIWDRRSFVLAHADAYSRNVVLAARSARMSFTDELNHVFLELVKAERLIGDAPAEGFWFEELFKRGVMGLNASVGPREEVEAKRVWMDSWGYGIAPFFADVGGLLTWSVAEGRFMFCAQRRTTGLLIPVEAIYAAATIGLMAIDLFTTTGARINEVMQIRLTEDCIARLQMTAPPGARDQSPRIRYVLRLVPKGEKTNTPQDYFIGEETKRLLVKMAQMLGEHYHLQAGEPLPGVEFNHNDGRAHRFGKAPYLFQYNHQHLSGNTITACMRFLLHGMVFKTREGKMVVLKSHLLRHAFATHAVQIEKIPIDIVGAWLHQKNLAITDYYSKPTESMVAEASDLFLSRVAAQINVSEAVLRSPDELQQLYESARGKAGTLADVIGGQCVSHGFCAAKFACVGCAGKVPEPAKRYQIEKHKQWALQQVDYATQEGLYPEAERMKQLVRDCDNEIAEMDLIESYQKDERREAKIQIEGQD